MIDGRQYLPTVAWSFKVRNVILLTSETTENPATFRCTANPFDSSEPGANTADKEIGYVVVDNVGNLYSVIDTGTYTVDLSDDFRSGVGPQTGKWAVISKTVGDGTAPFLTPIHYRRLDKSAIDNIHRIELDILWKHRLFTYTAFASDDAGTDFTLTNNSALPYMAVLVSDIEIETPIVSDFTGLWRSGSQVNGLGMSATALGDMGLPSNIDSTTENVLTEHSHTHKLGRIDTADISAINGYGSLINYKAAIDVRGLTSSSDWTVLNNTDWLELFDYIDAYPYPNIKVQLNALNFNIRLGGYRNGRDRVFPSGLDGLFSEIFNTAMFMSLDYHSETSGDIFQEFIERITFNDLSNGVDVSTPSYITEAFIETGFSIRLVRNATIDEISNYEDGEYCDDYVSNSGMPHKTIKIGNKVYLAENLNEAKFRNGDWIHGFEGGVYASITNEEWSLLDSAGVCYYKDNVLYGGGESTLSDILINLQLKITPIIIPFTDSSEPTISDYSIYATIYGQTPTVDLYEYYTEDTVTYLRKRPETFNAILVDGLITSVGFGIFDPVISGFIKITI